MTRCPHGYGHVWILLGFLAFTGSAVWVACIAIGQLAAGGA